MNDFLSWCRHLLVPFLFHDLTSLHPLHFIEMIFKLVPLIFYVLGQSPIKMRCLYNPVRSYHMRAQHSGKSHVLALAPRIAETTPYVQPTAHARGIQKMASFRSAVKRPTVYRRDVRQKKNDRSVSVHTSADSGDVW